MFSEGVALVVGGTGGLGRAVCEVLAKRGSSVTFTYHRNEAAALDLARSLSDNGAECRCWPLDLSDFSLTESRLNEIKAAYGRIHSVIYAAGPKIVVDYVSRHDPQTAARIIQQDVIGFFHLARATLPLFKAQGGGGSLTAITTTQGGNVEIRGALSAAPKAAIESLTRTIAKEEARNRIRANCVRAGWADIGLGGELLAGPLSEKAQQAILSAIPMHRFGTPQEIAEAVVFLASNRASFITGISIAADGGQHL